jgi:DNA-binding CsgD family transcriptional regulator/tetratricopeptide (TPR) repeat protein
VLSPHGDPGAPLVGRDRQAQVLRDLVASARDGRGGSVIVSGEAGIGKSRLVADVTRHAAAHGVTVLEGRCVALGDDPMRHAALVELLRDSRRSDGPAAQRADLADVTTERLLEQLLVVVDQGRPGSPVLIVVEDLHWADRATCEVLMVLARSTTQRAACLVLTCRTDELPRGHHVRLLLAELEQARIAAGVRLPRLGPADVATLIGLLGGAADDGVAARVQRLSAGNPLLVRELCAAWRAAGTDAVPEDLPLLGLLLVRVDRLSPAARAVADVVAVAGAAVDALTLDGVLAELAVGDEVALREALDRHVLVRRADHVEFHHVLVADAVRAQLLPAERRRFHRAWAEALRATAPIGVLAHHWAEAGAAREALTASISAGDLATADLAPTEAVRHYRRALELWAVVDDPVAVAGCSFVDLSRKAADSLHRNGDRRGAVAVLDAAKQSLDPGDAVTASVLAERTGWYLLRLGHTAAAHDAYAEAVALLPDDAPPSVRGTVLAGSVRSAERRHDARAGIELAGAAVTAVSSLPLRDRRHAHYMLARALVVAGEDGAAHDHLVVAAQAAEEALDPITHAVAILDRADLLAGTTGFDAVIEDADASAVRLRNRGRRDPNATLVLGVAASLDARCGRIAVARRRLGQIFDEARTPMTLAYAHALAGWCDLEDLATRSAFEHLEMARFLATSLRQWRLGATLSIARAEWARLWGALDQAKEAIDDGLRAIETTGDDELRGHLALLGLRVLRARAAGADRRTPASLEALDRDRALYTDIAEEVVSPWRHRHRFDSIAAELEAHRHTDPTAGAAAWLEAATQWDVAAWPRQARLAELDAASLLIAAGDRAGASGLLDAVVARAEAIESRALVEQARLVAERAGFVRRVPAATSPPANHAEPLDRLTRRERTVLDLVSNGATNREIGAALFISDKTASVHVSRILTKLGVSTRGEAGVIARRHR